MSHPVHFDTRSINSIFSNGDLKKQTSEIKQLEAENQRLKSENKKYKKELDIEDISKFDPISSTVLSRNPDQWMNTLVINQGSKDGIKKKMQVIKLIDLVGQIAKLIKFA